LVCIVAVPPLPANAPLAPVVGAVKVTCTPIAGDDPFITVATNRAAKAVLIGALCGVPPVAVIVSVVVPVFVRLKLTGAGTPVAEAVTV
jgi:hypothetical protein